MSTKSLQTSLFPEAMTIDEILSGLQRNDGHFAREAVRQAVARRDEIIPHLLDVLRDVAENPEVYADPDCMILIYAMYLLGQFREARAYPLLVRIFSLPGEMPFDLVGEVVHMALGRILACVSEGEIGAMTSMIENEQINPYVREAAMDGLLTLVACGLRTRGEIVDYFHGLFRKMERVYSDTWDSLACACCDLWPGEFKDELRSAMEEGLIDPGTIRWKDIESDHARGLETCLRLMRDKYKPVTDLTQEMAWWWCFEKDRPPQQPLPQEENPVVAKLKAAMDALPITVHRTAPKVGRNDPCPCGSGRKFKKCCGG